MRVSENKLIDRQVVANATDVSILSCLLQHTPVHNAKNSFACQLFVVLALLCYRCCQSQVYVLRTGADDRLQNDVQLETIHFVVHVETGLRKRIQQICLLTIQWNFRRGIKHHAMKMRCCYLILESQVDQTAKFILGGEVGSWYRGWGEGGEVLLLDTGESSRSTAKFILGGEVGSWYRGWGEGGDDASLLWLKIKHSIFAQFSN